MVERCVAVLGGQVAIPVGSIDIEVMQLRHRHIGSNCEQCPECIVTFSSRTVGRREAFHAEQHPKKIESPPIEKKTQHGVSLLHSPFLVVTVLCSGDPGQLFQWTATPLRG